MSLIARGVKFLKTLRRPSKHYSLGFLTIGGFVAGITFGGASIPHWKSQIRRRFASGVTRCEITFTKNSNQQSTTRATQAYERPVRIAMCPTNGPIRSPVRCKLQKKFGAHYSAPSIHEKNFSNTDADSPNMNGLA